MAWDFVAGQEPVADDFNAHHPPYVLKSATESVPSSTALQNDNELFLDLDAGRRYMVTAVLGVTGPVAADIKVDWTTTGTITFETTRACVGPGVATTTTAETTMRSRMSGATSAVTYGCDGSANWAAITETFIVNCTVAGRLQLRWAQAVSDATATNVHQGSSFLVAVPLS